MTQLITFDLMNLKIYTKNECDSISLKCDRKISSRRLLCVLNVCFWFCSFEELLRFAGEMAEKRSHSHQFPNIL